MSSHIIVGQPGIVKQTRKRVLGAAHPGTLTSMNNLAHKFKRQGRGDETMTLMTSCTELCFKVLGTAHPHTQAMRNTLLEWLVVEQIAIQQGEYSTRLMVEAWVDYVRRRQVTLNY
jgi:Tetratricopeptide repeat